MSESKKYQLISGIFNSKEALPIIMNFYAYKINYHNIQLLIAMEKNYNDTFNIQQKVQELQKTSEEIKKFLTESVGTDQKVKIYSSIEIDLVTENHVN